MRPITIRTASLIASGLLFASVAFAQAEKQEGATGPSLYILVTALSSWAESHPGAALILSLAAVWAIGMMIYGKLKPRS